MNEMSVDTATCLSKILSFLSEPERNKIPQEIWNEINKKMDSKVQVNINSAEDIKVENISPETRKYLSFIFLNYLATATEKKEYEKILKCNEENYQKFLSEKYSPDKIFQKDNEVENSAEEKELIPEQDLGFFKSIFNKLKKLFKHE